MAAASILGTIAAGAIGKKVIGSVAKKLQPPPLPEPKKPPEVPDQTVPAISPEVSKEMETVKEETRKEETKKKGRRASILTSSRGVQDKLGVVNRPQARAATLLG